MYHLIFNVSIPLIASTKPYCFQLTLIIRIRVFYFGYFVSHHVSSSTTLVTLSTLFNLCVLPCHWHNRGRSFVFLYKIIPIRFFFYLFIFLLNIIHFKYYFFFKLCYSVGIYNRRINVKISNHNFKPLSFRHTWT